MERNFTTISTVMKIAADYKRNYVKNGDNHDLHQRGANKILKLAEKNQGVYIKFGQHLASLTYLVPDEYINTLSVLHDKGPQSSIDAIDKMVLEDTGRSLSSMFKTIEPVPLGVGSLAQVHKCDNYAVKFQHPSIKQYAKQDMSIVSKMVRNIKYLFPSFNLEWLSDEMNTNLPLEMNFLNEANNAEQLRSNFFGYRYQVPGNLVKNPTRIETTSLQSFGSVTKVLKIPKIHFASNRVLCMEYIDGAKLNDMEYMRAHNIKPHQVARSLSYLFGNMIFLHGYLHCDPHLGNIMVQARPYRSVIHSMYNFVTNTPNYYLVLLDHGLYRTLSPEFRTSYAYLWQALISGQESEILEWSTKVGNGIQSYRLFSSILTGRSWDTITSSGLNTDRSIREQEAISRAGLYIKDIADILSSVPRELLLVLKTNDLLRHADYQLNCGPYISYFTLLRLVNVAIFNNEENIIKFVQNDIKWRMFDYSLGFYYTMRSLIK